MVAPAAPAHFMECLQHNPTLGRLRGSKPMRNPAPLLARRFVGLGCDVAVTPVPVVAATKLETTRRVSARTPQIHFARCVILACALLLLVTSATHAQQLRERWFVWEVGVSRSGEVGGLSVAGGASVRASRIIVSTIVEAVSVKLPDDNRRYWYQLSDGEERCEDSETEQFASWVLCAPDVFWAGMFEVSAYLAPRLGWTVGGGYRAGFGAGPYAVIGYSDTAPSSPTGWFVRARAGSNFLQLHIGATVSLPVAAR